MAITTITNAMVSVNAIQGTLIADNAITAVHIATNAVSGTLIADNAVTAVHIAQNTITVTQLADDCVESDKIADGVITTNHLNKAMISSQTEVTAVGGDFVLIGDTSDSNNLKKALVSDFGETNRLPLAGGTMTGDLILNDGVKLELGSASGGDLQIYHDGSDSYITDTGTGNLLIQYSDLYFSKDAGSTHSVVFRSTGRVGIGTTSPARDLVLKSEGATNGFRIESADENLFFLGAAASSGGGVDNAYFAQYAGGSVKLVIDSDGIKFNGDTAAANALDDYEEGTWTPAIYTYGGVTTTSSSMYGIYTKIGNICHIHCKISATLSSLPGQNWVITGLPFSGTNTNDANQRAIFAVGGDCVNTGGNTPKAHFRIAANELHGIYFNASNNTAYWTYNTMDSTAFEMNIHGFYTTT